MTYKAQFQSKKSIFFSGLNEYLAKASPGTGAANCNPAHDEDFSISFWCQSGTTSAEETIFANQYSSGSVPRGFRVGVYSGGNLRFDAYGESGSARIRYSIFTRPFAQYHPVFWHGVVTYNGASSADISSANLYIDGGLVEATGSGAIGTINNTSEAIEIGRRVSSGSGSSIGGYSGYFEGSLTHISFWNKNLSSEEVREIYLGRDGCQGPGNLLRHSAASNLKGWWIADNASDAFDGTIHDQSGNGKNMTANNLASTEHYFGGP